MSLLSKNSAGTEHIVRYLNRTFHPCFFLFFFLFFYQLYRPNGISPIGNSGCLPGDSQLRQSRATQPTVHVRCFSRFRNSPHSNMDYRILNVRTDVNVCNSTRGCTDTVRDPALKVDSGRKIPCRTGGSNLRQRRAGPTLCQLSYIPPPNPSDLTLCS